MSKAGIVYIMTNKNKTTLYIGVTNDLCRRIFEHKSHLNKNSFTDKYNLEYCIYYEEFPFFDLAIKREKELKKWNRQKKEDLINKKNPEWKVVATESGFVRDNKTFAQEVMEMVEEFEREEGLLVERGMTRGSSLTLGMTVPLCVDKSDIMDDKVIHYIVPSSFDERGHSERSEESINNKENKNE